MPFFSSSQRLVFRRKLLAWYRSQGRHALPWRRAFHPYHILVSEFMLQQTTVATVIPYFHRFMKSYPSIHDLARAPLENVLKQWAGLGYYARARNLHGTAQVLVRDFGGIVPTERALVEQLSGVGPYTAGALLSFAHDQPEALVDGNVIRVFSRFFGIKGDTRHPAALKKMWTLARALVPPRGARHFNSALMDFGATVCTPRGAACDRCPLSSLCWAQQNGWVDRLPSSRKETIKRVVRLNAFLVTRRGQLLLRRRPLGGLWGGLWEVPMGEASGPQKGIGLGGEGIYTPLKRLGHIRHVLSHRDLRVDLWESRVVSPGAKSRWVKKPEVQKMAISALTKKILGYVK
jgi:A/G-specific adenine glycosylase